MVRWEVWGKSAQSGRKRWPPGPLIFHTKGSHYIFAPDKKHGEATEVPSRGISTNGKGEERFFSLHWTEGTTFGSIQLPWINRDGRPKGGVSGRQARNDNRPCEDVPLWRMSREGNHCCVALLKGWAWKRSLSTRLIVKSTRGNTTPRDQVEKDRGFRSP